MRYRLAQIYANQGHTEEEIRQYTEKVAAELDKKSLREIVTDYSGIMKF